MLPLPSPCLCYTDTMKASEYFLMIYKNCCINSIEKYENVFPKADVLLKYMNLLYRNNLFLLHHSQPFSVSY